MYCNNCENFTLQLINVQGHFYCLDCVVYCSLCNCPTFNEICICSKSKDDHDKHIEICHKNK